VNGFTTRTSDTTIMIYRENEFVDKV